MKKHKTMAVICWGISVAAVLSAVWVNRGDLSEVMGAPLGFAAVWGIIGAIHWKMNGGKK